MSRIDPDIIHHNLCVNPKARVVLQKCWSFSTEKCATIIEEVDWLLATEFI